MPGMRIQVPDVRYEEPGVRCAAHLAGVAELRGHVERRVARPVHRVDPGEGAQVFHQEQTNAGRLLPGLVEDEELAGHHAAGQDALVYRRPVLLSVAP